MRDYSIILNSFQPQKNSFAPKPETLALLQSKLGKWRFYRPIGGIIRYESYLIVVNSLHPQKNSLD